MEGIKISRTVLAMVAVTAVVLVAGSAGLVVTRHLTTSVSGPPAFGGAIQGPGNPYPTQGSCQASGYLWDAQLGCAARPCVGKDGKTYQSWHLELWSGSGPSTYLCSGWTGTMGAVVRTVESIGTPGPAASPGSPHATTQASCAAAGFGWINGTGCFDQSCLLLGDTYGPGQSVIVWEKTAQGRQEQYAWCNGLTGVMSFITPPRRLRLPGGVASPLPAGNAQPPGATATTGPGGSHPLPGVNPPSSSGNNSGH